MEDCKDAPYSEEYYDLLVSYLRLENEYLPEDCIQNIDKDFNVVYLQSAGLPKLDIDQYTYSAIPKCFTTLDEEALQAGGIIKVQSQPNLALRGQGVLIGFVDTGIDYQNEVFRNSDGSSRILRIWDQSIQSGDTPEGFLYGTEYTKEQIDMALLTDAPLRVVPHRDEEGHGTFMAGLAAGSEKLSEKFAGVAPYAQIAMVKLKPAKEYLRRFYYIPEGAKAYQENDIMAGVLYLVSLAKKRQQPLVICLGLGTNAGSHRGGLPLARMLEELGSSVGITIVAGTGNETSRGHHFEGQISSESGYEDVEIRVAEGENGFFLELWASAPETYSIAIRSPNGEVIPRIYVRPGRIEILNFALAQTRVEVSYRLSVTGTGEFLALLRFINITPGVWTVRVYNDLFITGHYHMWLPIESFLRQDTVFLRPSEFITLTSPSDAANVISVSNYNYQNNSVYLYSGRGYTTDCLLYTSDAADD